MYKSVESFDVSGINTNCQTSSEFAGPAAPSDDSSLSKEASITAKKGDLASGRRAERSASCICLYMGGLPEYILLGLPSLALSDRIQ